MRINVTLPRHVDRPAADVYIEPLVAKSLEIYLYGFVLVLIPTATILGNALVIISVFRFRALHSAINFLILGLATADLAVAVFVMPYAVYVYVQGGYWLLGPTMCNLYTATDVACSTASITLLALISFDRYQAISHPIQYSRQSQNIRRVVKLFFGVWIYSLCVASPIVLGFNDPPSKTEYPFECRFYNPYFSILSSLVSFVIPCCLVVFVYLRIIVALRRREKAAKQRKAASVRNMANRTLEGVDMDEAGEIVAAPAINMIMAALPNLNRQIRRYERHKKALDQADEEDDDELGSSESDSLSENINVETNDFVSEIQTSTSRESRSSFDVSQVNKNLNARASIFVPSMSLRRKVSVPLSNYYLLPTTNHSPIRRQSERVERNSKNQFRSAISSMAGTAIAFGTGGNGGMRIQKGKDASSITKEEKVRASLPNGVLTAATSNGHGPSSHSIPMPASPFSSMMKARKKKSEAFSVTQNAQWAVVTVTDDPSFLPMNGGETVPLLPGNNSLKKKHLTQNLLTSNNSPTVTFKIPSPRHSRAGFALRRGSSLVIEPQETEDGSARSDTEKCMVDKKVPLDVNHIEREANNAKKSNHMRNSSPEKKRLRQRSATEMAIIPHENPFDEHTKSTSTSKNSPNEDETTDPSSPLVGEKALRDNEEDENRDGGTHSVATRSDLKRKVKKSQRKEKRATKTLGIVVGIFLICWVPFFTLNILNAVCVELGVPTCQIGFGPFFYTTWIGYMNSFMNPIIYTIFNAEFRRAFKSLILGRRASRRFVP